jgi:hypothetical protein
MALMPAYDPANLAAVMEPDPPGILVDAILRYRAALSATWAEDSRIRREKHEKERTAAAARSKR